MNSNAIWPYSHFNAEMINTCLKHIKIKQLNSLSAPFKTFIFDQCIHQFLQGYYILFEIIIKIGFSKSFNMLKILSYI